MNPDADTSVPENLVDLLDQLVTPPEPLPVSLVPQTAGWLVLAVVLGFALIWLVGRGLRHHRENAYRRAALAALSGAADDPKGLARIVRHTALISYPRTEVAGIYGEDWLSFLDKSCGSSDFVTGPGRFLAVGPYEQGATVPEGAVELIARWIKTHDRDVVL